jgi:antitoxin (DNA-binding transcriptional repressor) of toxin-antitoxin stability system
MIRSVGIRELKNRLSDYVRAVRRGDRILVTDRGVVVAELGPPTVGGREDHPYPGLLELARAGDASLGSGNDPTLYPALAPAGEPGLAQRLLDEERGDR